jgi:transposase
MEISGEDSHLNWLSKWGIATGFRGFSLHDELVGDGIGCIVTPPHTVTQEKCQKQKNDRVDCRRLSKNLENGDYRRCAVPSKQRREQRHVSRLYGQVRKDITAVKNRIRRALEYHGLDRYFPAGRWADDEYRTLEARLRAVGICTHLLFCFTSLLAQLANLRTQAKTVLVELRRLARTAAYRPSVKTLTSVPGIGTLTAIRLVLEWGDLRRFKRKECFASFVGLIPGEHSSGEQERKGHITKQGSRAVRQWLVESSWVCIRRDPVMLAKFNQVLHNSGSRKKAIVAVARKLALRIRALLIAQQPYVVGVLQ